MVMELATLLDRLAARVGEDDCARPPADWGEGAQPLARAILHRLRDRTLRPEHRRRIQEDLVAQRELLLELADPHLLDLVAWSEHVESLHRGLEQGKLETFHYTRALEATCRRCGFDLLPLMGRIEELGRVWGQRDLQATYSLVSPHFQ